MPYEQNQDGTDDCGHQRTNEAKHLDTQQTGKYPAHKGPGYPDQDIGENAMIGFSHLFSAIHPAIAPITSIDRKPTPG